MSVVPSYNNPAIGYFEELPAELQSMVREMLIDAFDNAGKVDTYPSAEESLEEIECHSRSGFVAYSSNRGGYEVKGFTDIGSIRGSGNYPAHVAARAEIERQVDYSYNLLAQRVFEEFQTLLTARGLTEADCFYHRMDELAQTDPALEAVRRSIEDGESEALGGEYSSIMYSARFLYHGVLNGIHRASISAAVNTEGPYHRSYISWAPNIFCEGAREIEIAWRTDSGLKRKLKAALDVCIKEIF